MARMNDTMRLKKLQSVAMQMQTNNERLHLVLLMLMHRPEFKGKELVFEADEIDAANALIRDGYGIMFDGTGEGSLKRATVSLHKSENKQSA